MQDIVKKLALPKNIFAKAAVQHLHFLIIKFKKFIYIFPKLYMSVASILRISVEFLLSMTLYGIGFKQASF